MRKRNTATRRTRGRQPWNHCGASRVLESATAGDTSEHNDLLSMPTPLVLLCCSFQGITHPSPPSHCPYSVTPLVIHLRWLILRRKRGCTNREDTESSLG